jgi:hypothetical protein
MCHSETTLSWMDDIRENHSISMHDEAIMVAGWYRFLANASPIFFVKWGKYPKHSKGCPMGKDANNACPKHKPPPCPNIVDPLQVNL